MKMDTLPHPGKVIHEIYLDPYELSVRAIAAHLQVALSRFARLVSGNTGVLADMTVCFSKVLRRSLERWVAIQANYDIWQAQQQNEHDDLEAIWLPYIRYKTIDAEIFSWPLPFQSKLTKLRLTF